MCIKEDKSIKYTITDKSFYYRIMFAISYKNDIFTVECSMINSSKLLKLNDINVEILSTKIPQRVKNKITKDLQLLVYNKYYLNK
jgi:hypothetical protein